MALSNVSWKGLKAVDVMLNTLPEKLGGKKLREAYRFSLKPTKEKMLSNLSGHEETGRLKYSIATTIGGTKDIRQMFGVTGPRRKRNVWNQQGYMAHAVETGTTPHTITAGPGKMMPIFTKAGLVGFAKSIKHQGTRDYKVFSKAMDSTFGVVADKISDKVAQIMREEIRNITKQYGNVVTKSDL
jgi:hypothetical protein